MMFSNLWQLVRRPIHPSQRKGRPGARRRFRPEVLPLEERTVPALFGLFSPATIYPTGAGPQSVAVGDFNHDGNPDLAVANQTAGTVNILIGNGAGGFDATARSPIPIAGASKVVAADFDNDGDLDFAVIKSSNQIEVHLNHGNGTFDLASGSPFDSGGNTPDDLAVADFNHDGKPDLAVSNLNSGAFAPNVKVFKGKGDGTFSTLFVLSTGITHPSAVVADDFNGDGFADLAVANQDPTNNVIVRLNDTLGGFGAPTGSFAVGLNPFDLAAGDFNGDGKLDLATANQNDESVSVLLGTGAGTFAPALSYAAGGVAPHAVAVGDFNLDGKSDLAVAVVGGVSMLQGDGHGGFTPAPGSPFAGVSGSSTSLVAADFNHDGALDLVEVNSDGSGVAVLLNHSNQPAGDATPFVSIRRGKLKHRGRRFKQTLTITNVGGQAIQGPLTLVLDKLTKKVQLLNKTGVTLAHAPVGSPLIELLPGAAGTFAPGQSVSVTLVFKVPPGRRLAYVAHVLAGVGLR